jgi:hypothetical protein
MRALKVGLFILLCITSTSYAALEVDSVSFGSTTKRHQSVYRSSEYSDIILKSTPYSRLTFFESNVQPLDVVGSLVPVGGDVEAEILGSVFNYPNPFKFGSGTTIGYALSKDMDIEVQVYNIRGQRIWKTYISAGDPGAVGSDTVRVFNKVPFGADEVDGFMLPSTVYFYLVMHDGEVLGKGKMAVIP